MAIKDAFQPDRSPIFLSDRSENAEQPDIGKAWAVAAISSRILKASMLVAMATALGIAVLAMGDPVELVANVTASWTDKPALQPEAEPSAPAVQSAAVTQDSPPTTTDAPASEQVAVASEPAGQAQAETGQPISEALFKQFQAWAAEAETRTPVEPVQSAQDVPPVQPIQDAPVRVTQDTPPQAQPVKKHRRARSVHNARAEIRPQRHYRARAREEQSAPIPIAPVPDARAPEPPLQNSQTPSLLQSFGLR